MAIPVMLMIRELNLGGSERQMTEVARSLDRSRFEPHVGCFRAGGIRGDELRAAGVPVAEFPVHSYKSWSTVNGARSLIRYIREHHIRLVHTFDYPLNVFGMPIAHFFTNAAAVSSQRAHRELTPGLYAHLQRATDRFVDGIVVNCEFLKRHLASDYGVPGSRIYLCYNGIDLTTFQPGGASVRAVTFGPGSLVIGVVCALRPEKGLLTLLEAFAQVRHLQPGLKLAMVGSGSMLERVQSRARELSIFEDCVWQPGTANVAEWLRSIDIFVLPSLSEALSNSLMEAMACGCCCIASDVGGNPELIADGERGLLFQTGDAGSLASALEKLILNPDLRRTLSESACQFLHERFSIQASANRMGEIYVEILGGR
jgi:L-malate glycosyltransferase